MSVQEDTKNLNTELISVIASTNADVIYAKKLMPITEQLQGIIIKNKQNTIKHGCKANTVQSRLSVKQF